MGLINDILDEIMAATQGKLYDKVRQFIDQEKVRKKLNNMEEELDAYLKENYGNELYYDSLYRYIHNGNISQDTYSDGTTSAFYYTLICAFLNSDDKFLGENRFFDYHWTKIQKVYPDNKYDKNNIKKCFSYFYNTFKTEFGCPSDSDKASVNSIKETVIESNDSLMKTITDKSDSINEIINKIIEIYTRDNAEEDIQSEKEEIICDDNKEYQERLQDYLFLELDIDDEKKLL